MKTNEKHEAVAQFARQSLVLVGLLVAALCCGGPSRAQSSAASGAATTKPAAPSAKNPASQAKGQHEGITVHGHWTIEVRNPDGKVAVHREFENSLMQIGGGTLGFILARYATFGSWEIFLCDSSDTVNLPVYGCGSNLSSPTKLRLVESGSGPAGTCSSTSGCYSTLSAPSLDLSSHAGAVTLTGTIANAPALTINAVMSLVSACYTNSAETVFVSPSTFSPAACLAAPYTSGDCCSAGDHAVPEVLTASAVSPDVKVVAGQAVSVTVVISFQ